MKQMSQAARWMASAALVLCLSVAAWAQARATGGAIEGVVKDSTGAVIGGAMVTVRNTDTGLTREVVADGDGFFRAPALDAGPYEVTATASGFAAQARRTTLVIGQAATLEIVLAAGGDVNVVTVETDAAPIVEASRTQQSSVINERAVKDLPVNGRNFLEFIRLTPGINVDPRGGDFSAGGLRGTFNSLLIDGADNNNTFFGQSLGRTGVRAPYQFSQSSVKEFQVNTNSFAAEFGRAGGAVVNVITKSGTNEFHGEAFEFFRDRSLNAQDGFLRANNRPKPRNRINQFGGSIGGPIKKDKLFFFFTYDGQRRSDPIVPVLTVSPGPLSPANAALVNAATAPYAQEFNQNVYLGKVDWQINGSNQYSVRYNRQLFKGTNLENGGTTRAASATGNSDSTTDTFTNQLTTVINPTVINEARFLFSRDQQLGTANSDMPETTIRQGGQTIIVFGRNNFSPRETTERRFQFIDTLTLIRGRHTFKFGVDLVANRILNFFPGFFSGAYSFESFNNFNIGVPNSPTAFQQAFAGAGTNGPRSFPNSNEYAFFIQDDWSVTSRLKLYYGVRYDAQLKNRPAVPNLDPQLAARGIRTAGFEQDMNNFAPRVGFAFQPFRDGKTAIRGGFGIFYARTPSIVTGTAITQNGVSVQQLSFGPTANPGNLTPIPAGLTFPNVLSAPPTGVRNVPNLFFFAPDYVDPLVYQSSFGVERELTRDISLGVSYLFTRGSRLTRTRDINVGNPTPAVFNVRNAAGQVTGQVTLPRFPSQRPLSNFGRLNQFESTGDSVYHALAVEVKKRFSKDFQFLMSYTYSAAIDNRPDQTIVTGGGGDSSRLIQNSLNIAEDRGRGDSDIPHRFVFSGVYDVPFARNLQSRFAKAVLDGYSLSGIVTVTSGRNFSALASGDVNNDGNNLTDRAPFVGRNTFRRERFASVDLRVSRTIRIREKYRIELFGEGFNLFNRFNPDAINVNQFLFGNVGGVPTFTENRAFRSVVGNSVNPRNFQLAAKFVF
jgi:outer membrane receptor protein involved in Fe transport